MNSRNKYNQETLKKHRLKHNSKQYNLNDDKTKKKRYIAGQKKLKRIYEKIKNDRIYMKNVKEELSKQLNTGSLVIIMKLLEVRI